MTLLQRLFGREKEKPQFYAWQVERIFNDLGIDMKTICPESYADPPVYFDSLDVTFKEMGGQLRIVITGNYEVTSDTSHDSVRKPFKIIGNKPTYVGGTQ